MHERRFDELLHAFATGRSRRATLASLASGILAAGSAARWESADARKKGKRQKIKRNEFGCVNVGSFCKNSGHCCSGICQGKKGKRKCRAHDSALCDQDAAGVCTAPNPVATACNNRADCACITTTGGSSICAELFCGNPGCSECADCRQDADCLALGFPAGVACAPVSKGLCAGFCETGMACVLPCGAEPPPQPERVR